MCVKEWTVGERRKREENTSLFFDPWTCGELGERFIKRQRGRVVKALAC